MKGVAPAEEAADFDWDEVPLERLEVELTTMAAHISAASARWLGWLAVYDRRKGYESWGCRSSAHWLSWKCGLSLGVGREKVRVALALEGLPAIRATFGRGELSYSKVRALTRVANADNEADLLSVALDSTASQLDRICAGVATTKKRAAGEANDAVVERRMSKRNNYDGTVTYTVVMPVSAAAELEAGVDARVDSIIEDAAAPGQPRREVVDERGGIAALRVDALVELVTSGADGEAPVLDVTIVADLADLASALSADDDESKGSFQVNGTAVAASVMRRLTCDSRREFVLVSTEFETATTPTRTPNRAMRRAIGRRDHHMCTFPGCGSTRRLRAHHVVHWSQGGPTEVDNLVLLCDFHHHVVHEGGWNLTACADGNFEFIAPDGSTATIGHSRGSVTAITDQHANLDIGPATIQPRSFTTAANMSWITTVIFHNEELRRTRRLASV